MSNEASKNVLKIILLSLFAVAMGYFEAAVVVYLRDLLYPDGFSFPLRDMPVKIIVVELFRELSTMVMLVAVAALSGRRFWERFGFFIFIFGVWDIFYYIWLKVIINWPPNLLEWDILFLIPAPWIAPVIAPMSISILMIFIGLSIINLFCKGRDFKPILVTWALAILATASILFSFMRDRDAMFNKQTPEPYLYGLLVLGLIFYIIAYFLSYKKAKEARRNLPSR